MSDLPDVPRDPDLSNLLALHAETVLENIRVMLPGSIVSYDAGSQSAEVQLLIQDVRYDEEGKRQTVTIPHLHNVPVMFAGPARGRITWPVADGDLCEVRFASSSLARFVAAGNTDPTDPGDARRHELSDAIAWVGLHSPAAAPTDAPTNAICLHAGGGIFILLGSSSASEQAVKGNTYRTAEDIFFTALQTAFTAINTYAVAIAAIADPSDTATPVLTAALTVAFTAALASFQGAAATYLSNIVKLQ